MAQQKVFAGPAVFFIVIMILGNFMLLNLFLAILLKSISGEEEEAPDEEEQLRTSVAVDLGENPDKEDQPVDHEDIDAEEDSEGSICLNSSNSNIDVAVSQNYNYV